MQHSPAESIPMSGGGGGGDWATSLLTECAAAITDQDVARAKRVLWALNEMSSAYGTYQQRLAYYFMQALFCRLQRTGPRTYLQHCAAAERNHSFDAMRKTMLKYQEASPWTMFGHVASNGAILEALEGESRAHIIDLSDTLCTQWPTLLEALATRAEGAPNLRLTTVVFHDPSSSVCKAMEELGARLDKFARLMGVPFQFTLLNHTELHDLLQQESQARHDQSDSSSASEPEALAINCIQTLHRIPPSQRQATLCMLHNLNPKILTLVEDDVEIVMTHPSAASASSPSSSSSSSFTHCFSEALRFYSLLFESLDESLPKTSSERLAIERAASRSFLHILACDELPEVSQHELRERAAQWNERLHRAGFVPKGFSDDVFDDVKALLKRYREGWGLSADSHAQRHDGITLTWRDQNVICASAWRPSP